MPDDDSQDRHPAFFFGPIADDAGKLARKPCGREISRLSAGAPAM